jgi:hypothetical protein
MTEWNWNGWWAANKDQAALDSLFAKGIGAASYLHAILRQGDLITLATQSMLVGSCWPIDSIRVDKDNNRPAYMMPSGIVTTLYSQNHGAEMLAVDLSNAEFYHQPYKMGQLGPAEKVAYVDVLAGKNSGPTLEVTSAALTPDTAVIVNPNALLKQGDSVEAAAAPPGK